MKCYCGLPFIKRTPSVSNWDGYVPNQAGHAHEAGCEGRSYFCSEKHNNILSIRKTCSKCDWKGKETCFCHKGKKIDAWPDEVEIIDFEDCRKWLGWPVEDE